MKEKRDQRTLVRLGPTKRVRDEVRVRKKRQRKKRKKRRRLRKKV